jgi:hypothetical protein
VPKVIDFGIAKATQQELTEKTVYTQFQQFIGRPAFMSPADRIIMGTPFCLEVSHYKHSARLCVTTARR